MSESGVGHLLIFSRSARVGCNLPGKFVVVIIGEDARSQSNHLQMVHASHAGRWSPRVCPPWEHNADQQDHHRDDDNHFDEC